MIRNLLATAILLASTLTLSASTIKVWEGNVKLTGWSDNVKVASSEFVSASEGCKLVVNLTVDMTLDPTISYTNLGAKTNTDGWPELDGTGFQNPDGTSASWDINAKAAEQLKATGLILQGQNVIVTSVDLITTEDIDPNILFEGELTLSGWNKGADISPAKLKLGDALKYTFTSSGSDNAQVLVKNSSWANLLGTTKITPADMKTGSVVIGVTQEMIDNNGGQIFLQGDGGCVVTKVELMPSTFDANGVICYGERIPGVNIYTVLPEGTEKIAVVFTKAPGWAQICNTSWTAMVENGAATSVENADGSVTMTFPLTKENVETINSAKEMIVNSDTNILSVSIPSATTGIEMIEMTDENAPVEYFNIQGIRVNDPTDAGLYIRRQGNKTTKVLIK